MFDRIINWLTSDYETAKRKETDEIITRYSRGNVCIQNGWYLDREDVDRLSSAGDEALAKLEKELPDLRDSSTERKAA